MDPIDREAARLRARGDQLREAAREALLEMDPEDVCHLFRTCASGDISALDERTKSIVAWLGLVAMLDLLGNRSEEGSAEA